MDARALQYYQYLVSKGESPQVAAAIMGNIGQESSFNATLPGDGGRSVGLFQFNKGGELPALQTWAANNSRDINDPYAQLDFVRSQLQSPAYAKVYGEMQSSPSLAGATSAFMNGYERPTPKYANPEARINYANQFINPTTQDAGTPTPGNRPGDVADLGQGMQGPTVPGLLSQQKSEDDDMKMAMGLLQKPSAPAWQSQVPQAPFRRPQPFSGFNFLG
jgi:hypothetical protein